MKPQKNLPVAIVSDIERRFRIYRRLLDADDQQGAEAFWACSSIQRGSHIDSLPIQIDEDKK